MTGQLENKAGKLGNIKFWLNFNQPEPYVTLAVTMQPHEFDSGPEKQYRVAIGCIRAQVFFDHPAYELDGKYEAELPKAAWSVIEKDSTQYGWKGLLSAKFGYFFAKASGEASANKSHLRETRSSGQYPLIESTVDGWLIGGMLGDPRKVEEAVGEAKGLLRGQYFVADEGDTKGLKKTKDGKPIVARLRLKHGANNFNVEAVLAVPKDSLRVLVTRKNVKLLNKDDQTNDHGETLKEALIKICVARELETRGSEAAVKLSEDEIFIDRYVGLGQKPPGTRK